MDLLLYSIKTLGLAFACFIAAGLIALWAIYHGAKKVWNRDYKSGLFWMLAGASFWLTVLFV